MRRKSHCLHIDILGELLFVADGEINRVYNGANENNKAEN